MNPMEKPGQKRWRKAHEKNWAEFPPNFSRLCVTHSKCTERCIRLLIPNFRTERAYAKQWAHLLAARDGMKCHYCGAELGFQIWYSSNSGVQALSVDHLFPVSKGGTDELSNFVLACHTCNSTKQNRTYEWMIARTQKRISQ